MKNQPFSNWIRLVLIACSALLIVVLYVPIWRIELDAPQYPEGLGLQMHANKLAGNVDIINGVNHYIGMKKMHTEDFWEFKVLPYIIGGFAAFFFLVGILRNRKLMLSLFIAFALFGVLSMVDFWMWEYNYGHNLDPHAAIIVPGMSYQPPLIGFKQLLNFGAYSVPDIGGWIFIAVALILLFCIIMDFREKKKLSKAAGVVPALLAATIMLSFASCGIEPSPIKIGKDNCEYCKMTISDNRFGAEIVTVKGKPFKFDDTKCLMNYIETNHLKNGELGKVYLVDYCGKHDLIEQKSCMLMKSEGLKSPMGGNVASFSSLDSLKKFSGQLNGEEIKWEQLTK